MCEIERLRAQLPEGMRDCTIRFTECAVGHGRLLATNWLDSGCPYCEIDRLRALLRLLFNKDRPRSEAEWAGAVERGRGREPTDEEREIFYKMYQDLTTFEVRGDSELIKGPP